MTTPDTKSRLLQEGTNLFLQKGFHNTGIQDILNAADVPKGSFYHHFNSKEDFGLQVVDLYNEATLEQLDKLLRDRRVSPQNRIKKFFQGAFDEFSTHGCRHGCLMGNLGQELADVNDVFRERIHGHLESWAKKLAECIEWGVTEGMIVIDQSPITVARLLIDGFQGAALRMKLQRGPAPLNRFMKGCLGVLIKPA